MKYVKIENNIWYVYDNKIIKYTIAKKDDSYIILESGNEVCWCNTLSECKQYLKAL